MYKSNMILKSNGILGVFITLSMCSCSMCSHLDQNSQNVSHMDIDSYPTEDKAAMWSSIKKIGYPLISDTIPSRLFERICYSVSYNKETRQPNWVMWELTSNHVNRRKDGIWNDYREDNDIEEMYRATLADYASSGYDRGHMCPGGDCNWSDKGRDETFLLSNMCPQNPNLNRGDWKEIEIACRKWARKYGHIYIVCGPIFFKSQEHVRIGEHQIPVPEAFFKVILCLDSLNSKGIGFICRNTEGNRTKDFYVNSIRQVERVTGYKFFNQLDESIKEKIFDMYEISEW